jgi:hypothetical protein
MLEFPNVQCSQNAVTAAGNLLIAIHKMAAQTQIPNDKQLVQDGKNEYRFYFFNFAFVFLESDRLLADLIPNLCTIINTTTSRSLAQIALDTIKCVLEEIKLDMLKHVGLLEKIAYCVQKVLAYKVRHENKFFVANFLYF